MSIETVVTDGGLKKATEAAQVWVVVYDGPFHRVAKHGLLRLRSPAFSAEAIALQAADWLNARETPGDTTLAGAKMDRIGEDVLVVTPTESPEIRFVLADKHSRVQLDRIIQELRNRHKARVLCADMSTEDGVILSSSFLKRIADETGCDRVGEMTHIELLELTRTKYPEGDDMAAFVKRVAPIIAANPNYPYCKCSNTEIWADWARGIKCPICGQEAT